MEALSRQEYPAMLVSQLSHRILSAVSSTCVIANSLKGAIISTGSCPETERTREEDWEGQFGDRRLAAGTTHQANSCTGTVLTCQQERRKVEDQYVAGLRKLARKPLQETGQDLG